MLRIRVLNKNPLYDYKEFNKVTQGIDLEGYDVFPPEDEVAYWIKQFVCNHSNVRSIHFRIIDERPKSVIMQLIRATKGNPQPFVQSSRPSRSLISLL